MDKSAPVVGSRDFVERKLVGASRYFPRDRLASYAASLHAIAPNFWLERQNIHGSQVRVGDPRKLADKRVLVITGTDDLDHSREADGAIVTWLKGHGAKADFCFLADRGIVGNGHMLMLEQNSDEIAGIIIDWLESARKPASDDRDEGRRHKTTERLNHGKDRTRHGSLARPAAGDAAGAVGRRVEADRRNPALVYRDGTFKFDELAKLRAKENLEEQIELPGQAEALRRLPARHGGDGAGVQGGRSPTSPSWSATTRWRCSRTPIFRPSWCASARRVENIPFSEEQKKRLPPGIEIAEPNHHGKTAQTYPGHPQLGRHLIEKLVQHDFDIAASARLPQSATSNISGLPHAYGFIYRRIMQENYVPAVPLFINTFYPPNQPSVRRCFSLGNALVDAIETLGRGCARRGHRLGRHVAFRGGRGARPRLSSTP